MSVWVTISNPQHGVLSRLLADQLRCKENDPKEWFFLPQQFFVIFYIRALSCFLAEFNGAVQKITLYGEVKDGTWGRDRRRGERSGCPEEPMDPRKSAEESERRALLMAGTRRKMGVWAALFLSLRPISKVSTQGLGNL